MPNSKSPRPSAHRHKLVDRVLDYVRKKKQKKVTTQAPKK